MNTIFEAFKVIAEVYFLFIYVHLFGSEAVVVHLYASIEF